MTRVQYLEKKVEIYKTVFELSQKDEPLAACEKCGWVGLLYDMPSHSDGGEYPAESEICWCPKCNASNEGELYASEILELLLERLADEVLEEV